LNYANKELASMQGYYGQVHDIDISLFRGAYIIDSIYINKVDTSNASQTPFLSAKVIDLSVEWKSLFQGRIVGEMEFINPKVIFTKDKAELAQVQKDTNDFRKILKTFMPLKINRFEIKNGELSYIDKTSQPKVDIKMEKTYIEASNLSSVQDTALLPSRVTARANVYEGVFRLEMKLDALAEAPLFDMNVKVEKTNLPALNDFFKAYAKFDVNKGEFNVYSEIAAKDGKFAGYVKPVIKNLDVVGPEDRDDKFLNKVWEQMVGLVGVIVKNRKQGQIATKIPISGEIGGANVGVITAVIELLRNAFIEALYPSIDQQISLESVEGANAEKKGFFKRLFKNDNKDKGKDDKESNSEKK